MGKAGVTMGPFGHQAAILCCGYGMGYYKEADIEHWAERQIDALDEPPLPLIELTTIRGMYMLPPYNRPFLVIPSQPPWKRGRYQSKAAGPAPAVRGARVRRGRFSGSCICATWWFHRHACCSWALRSVPNPHRCHPPLSSW